MHSVWRICAKTHVGYDKKRKRRKRKRKKEEDIILKKEDVILTFNVTKDVRTEERHNQDGNRQSAIR